MQYGVVYPKIIQHENLLHKLFLTRNILDLRYIHENIIMILDNHANDNNSTTINTVSTIILSDVYCEISRVVKARIALVRCGVLTTSDISQYALDNVFIICQCACA